MSVRLRQWTSKDGNVQQAWTVDVQLKVPGQGLKRVRDISPINTRRGAEAFERQVRQSLLDGSWNKEVIEVPTVAVFAPRFLEHAKTNNKFSTYRTKTHLLNGHVLPYFGSMKLDQVTAGRIEAFKAQLLGKKLSKKSVNNVLTCLGKLLSLAFDWGELNHVPKIQWLKSGKPDFDFLSFEEAETLVSKAEEGRWQTMIVVALNTGLRIGELCGLQWGDIDLKAGRLLVKRNVHRGELDTPKGGRSREVPLNERVTKALQAWPKRLGSPWVFPQDDGDFMRNPQHAAAVAIGRNAALAGLQSDTRSIGWHTLRHTFASHLTMKGLPLRVLQGYLGHSTIAMTERYAHLSPTVAKEGVRLLDAAPEQTRGTYAAQGAGQGA